MTRDRVPSAESPDPQAPGAAQELRLLGGFGLLDAAGQPLRLPTRKAEALLAVLALRPGQPQARDKLCALLWPDVRPEQARHSLRQTLLQLRKLLPAEALGSDARGLQLKAAAMRVDVARLEQSAASGSRAALLEVLASRGELLEGLSVAEPSFEHWLRAERLRLRLLSADALMQLTELELSAGRHADAQRACTRVLELDPLREEAHRVQLRLFARSGRSAAALAHYRSLRAQLGAEPDPLTRQLHAELEREGGVLELQPMAAATSGRTRELEQLRAALAAAAAGQPRVAVLAGEAGVGKSHLCERVALSAAELGFCVLRARCFESEQVLPLSAWANLLRDAITPELALSAKQRAELSALLPELSPELPARTADARQLFQAVQALVTSLAQPAPLLLLLEDVHWADEMSARLLSYLGRHQRQGRCLLLVSAREEDVPAASFIRAALAELAREQLLLRVELAPLAREETRELSERLAGQAALPPLEAALHDQIWAISEGNPLVIVETIRALACGALARDVTQLPVPERVRSLILGRVARVSADAREVLSLAAVAGRELEPEVLLAALPGLPLSAALDELGRAQLVRAVEERVYFTHDRIRETLYNEMLPLNRRLLHGRVARALEPRIEQLPAALGHIGYHYSKAGDAPAAVRYLVRFAERAFRDHGVGEALAALERAYDDSTRLPQPERDQAALEITIRQAACLIALGRFSELVTRLAGLLPTLEALRAPQLAGPFHFYWSLSLALMAERREADAHAQRALTEASQAEDTRMLGNTHALLSYLCQISGRSQQGVSHGELAIRLLEACPDSQEATAMAWLALGMNRLWLGDVRAALAAFDRAAALAGAVDDRRAQALAATAAGCAHCYAEQWPLALEATQRGIDASKDPLSLVSAVYTHAWARSGSGHPDEAITLLTQLIDELAAHGVRAWSGHSLTILADACVRTGDFARAARLAAEALEIATATDDPACAGWAMRTQAQAALAQGERALARACLSRALGLFETLQTPIDAAKCLVERAELELAEGDHGAALQDLARARELFTGCEVRAPLERIAQLTRSAQLGPGAARREL